MGERGFRFAPGHRTLLAAGLPVGSSWPDWRGAVFHALRNDAVDALPKIASVVEDPVGYFDENEGLWKYL